MPYCGVLRGGVRPPPSLVWPWIFKNHFCTVFVSFVSRWNRKIRVLKLLVTVRVFCLLKTAVKCTQTYHFVDKKDIFGGNPSITALRRLAPSLLKSWIRHWYRTGCGIKHFPRRYCKNSRAFAHFTNSTRSQLYENRNSTTGCYRHTVLALQSFCLSVRLSVTLVMLTTFSYQTSRRNIDGVTLCGIKYI